MHRLLRGLRKPFGLSLPRALSRGLSKPALQHLRIRLRQRDPIHVDLDVGEQLILLYLLRFPQAPARDLLDEVRARRPLVVEQQVRLSLIRLESLRLIELVPTATALDPSQSRGRLYRLTADGRRLRRALPPDPRSSLQTYL